MPLKSGGSLFIDSTEALVAIDVNSGRTNGNGVLEEMVYKVNMEAAVEIPRQTAPARPWWPDCRRFH